MRFRTQTAARLGLVLALVCGLAGPARAQVVTGSLVGTVRDQSGGVLPGVTVTVESPALIGGLRTSVTNEDGFFRFPSLPPGFYTLVATLQGFATYRAEALRVVVAGTVERDAVLRVSGFEETTTVVGDTPVIDTQSAAVGTTYTQEWVENAPMRRFSMFDLINTAPGVTADVSTFGTGSNVFGSGVDDNLFHMDGTDLTAPVTGRAWVHPNVDAIQEMSVVSLGAPAEYGNAPGAVFNIVTRQGGNAFEGDLSFYFQNDGLTGRNTADDQDRGFPFYRERYNDLTAQVGGPIRRDRVWFFGSYQYQRDFAARPGVNPAFPAREEHDRGFVKVTAQLDSRNKLMLAFHDNRYYRPRSGNVLTDPSAVHVNYGRNPTPNATWTSVLSDRTFVEARYAGFYGKDHAGPSVAGEPRVKPRFWAADTGRVSGGVYLWYDGTGEKTGVSGKVTHFADRFLGTSHEFRMGVQYSEGGGQYTYGYNDYIYTSGGVPYLGATQLPLQNWARTSALGVFIDDTVRAGSRVALNLGVRADRQVGSFPASPVLDRDGRETGQLNPAVPKLFGWNTVSPRLGIVYKLTDDGRTTLSGHYGRFYAGVVTTEFVGVGPGITPRYWFDGVYDAAGNPVGLVLASDNSQLRINPGYKAPNTDQFIIGVERELRRHLAVSAHYVRKHGERLGGWQESAGVYEPAIYHDTVGAQATGREIPVYRLLTPLDERVFLLTNPDPAIRGERLFTRYQGVSLQMTKRMADNWQGIASLVLSRERGIRAHAHYSSAFFSSFGRNPNDYVNHDANSHLRTERPVVVKLQMVGVLPHGVTVAGSYSHQAGRPWTRTIRVPGLGVPTTIFADPVDGTRRWADLNFFDLRLQKTFDLAGGTRLSLMADTLNLLNSGANEGVLSTLGTSSAYGLPGNFILPRRLMLGAKVQFDTRGRGRP